MRSPVILIAVVALLLAPSVVQAYGVMYGSRTCNGDGTTKLEWTFYEDAPFGHPEWVGYDVLRKRGDQCGAFERLNSQIIPRGTGAGSFVDPSPVPATLYEYQVVPVNLFRNQLSYPDFYIYDDYGSCPDRSAPVALGTLADYGWALFVLNCPESCLPGGYVENAPADLRAYAGTDVVLRFYGSLGCGTIEGCSLRVDRYEVADCAPVPTLPATWGKVKANYR